MKLTPIQVKGKGRQKKTWTAPDPQRALKRHYDQLSQDATSDDAEDGGTRRRRLKTKKPAALIELLPTEVLERILFMSMNLNLLRSSRRLGYRFSTKSFLTGLLTEAFAPNWEVWFGCNLKNIRSYYNFRLDAKRVGGDPEFQSLVLTLPWVTITRLLEAQQQWYRKHGAGRYFEHLDPYTRTPHCEPGDKAEGFDHAHDVAACFEADWNSFASGYADDLIGPPLNRMVLDKPHYIDMHPSTRIPERLLGGGPLDLDKAKLLFWLIRGGACLLHNVHIWELTKRGYENIMTLDDTQLALQLLRLFLRLGVISLQWPEFLVHEKLDEAIRQTEYYETHGRFTPAARLWWFARKMLE